MDDAGRGAAVGAGAVTVDGIRVPTHQALVQALDAAGAPAPRAFADLSLGARRSHQAAGELLAQVTGRPPTLAVGPGRHAQAGRLAHAAFISAGVDAEAQGSRPVLLTLRLVQALLVAVGEGAASFVVLAPRFGLPWDLEDELFIRLLATRLRQPARLVIASAGPGDPPDVQGVHIRWRGETVSAPVGGGRSLLALVPGVVEPALWASLRERDAGAETPVALLAGGYGLVAPEHRRPPPTVSRLRYDELHAAAAALGVAWLETYAQYRGNNIYVRPHDMAAQAWERFEEGGSGVALRLMARAAECAPFPDSQWLDVQMQGMRLALTRYGDAAADDDPSPAYERAVRGFLLGAKGWGLVMGEDPGRAERYLEEARQLLGPDNGLREHLYLLNVSALSKLKTGDLDAAMAMEIEIETRRAALRPPDWPLEYVNAINIARLHMRRGNLNGARRYYEQAFATTLGVRSESDCIYMNLCFARLEASAGRWREAFHAWLRAALHWAASRAPEALAPRAAAAILRRWPSPAEDVTEDVAYALARQLAASARQAGIEVPTSAGIDAPAHLRPASFVPLESLPGPDGRLDAALACGSEGWAVVVSTGPPGASRRPPADRWLRALLHELLVALAPVDELREAGCLAVDDRLGRELPADAPELLGSCVRLGLPRLWFNGADVELGEDLRRQLEATSVVRPGSAVDRLEDRDGVRVVVFKRYRAPYRLSEPESRLLARCMEDEASVAALARGPEVGGWHDAVGRIRALEEARVLDVDLKEAACLAAGLKLPTSASLSAT
jgi:tetratricopeptide (TPR) repeat protein